MKTNLLAFTSILVLAASCNSAERAALPDPPASARQIEAFIKGKKLTVENVGFFGVLTVNDKRDVDWIDSTSADFKDNPSGKEVLRELSQWSLQFGNDTTGTVISKGQPYASTWIVDETAKDDEKPGIRIRVAYKDPSFSFGGEPMEVTFSHLVKGVNEKQILLELPRTINRRELVALMNIQ